VVVKKPSRRIDSGGLFSSAGHVVIKLGTHIVTAGGQEFCVAQVEPIVRSIARLKSEGRRVVLVSSGAIGLGANRLGLNRARLNDLAVRQACAAVGQSLLMHSYEKLFSAQGIKIAQLLLTEDDFIDWKRYRNLQQAMEKLLKLGVLPIVNENDTVSTAELEYRKVDGQSRIFSDNDRLAALITSKLYADALIILTNVNGLMGRNPSQSGNHSAKNHQASVIPLVTEITPELKSLAVGSSVTGRGGMLTKLEAAEIAMSVGAIAAIANGTKPDTLERLFAGEGVGTLFLPAARLKGKRRWIAYAATVKGQVIVNEGAQEALVRGKASLLTSGVVRIENLFASRDVVSILDPEGHEFARGIINYASHEVQEIIQSRNENLGKRNGTRSKVLITRDNIVLLDTNETSG